MEPFDWIDPESAASRHVSVMMARLIAGEADRLQVVARIVRPAGKFDRQIALRQFYAMADKEIKEAGASEWGIDAYEVDWLSVFTPIEYALWHDIRGHNCILYPQYPVGRYFVDFANPVAKVAIECDGASWHQDAEKDASRQAEIEALGWTVYRITGRDCKTDFNEETMEPGAAKKFIKRIAAMHGIRRGM